MMLGRHLLVKISNSLPFHINKNKLITKKWTKHLNEYINIEVFINNNQNRN